MIRAEWGWIVALAVVVTAMARAATAPSLPAMPLDEVGRRKAFASMAQAEVAMRKQALHDWPADPWSEDDHFHHLEHQRAEAVARELGTSESEVLRALDDGMRGRWLGVPMRTTVPPCRPRPITD